jgi:hypothetical protein
MPSWLRGLLGGGPARCWQEPDLEDFLAWPGATLEYWLRMVFAAVAGRMTWAARGETPLITACPAANAKTNVKWADGALIWPGGTGALVEVKAIPLLRPAKLQAVATDLAALLAVDWPRPRCSIPGPDAGVDERWWQARHDLTESWALSIALLHGDTPLPDGMAWIAGRPNAGLAALQRRFPDNPPWTARTMKALAQHIFMDSWSGGQRSVTILAWAAPTATPLA